MDNRKCEGCPLEGVSDPCDPVGDEAAPFMVVTDTPTKFAAKSGHLLSKGPLGVLSTAMVEQGFSKRDFQFVPQIRCPHEADSYSTKEKKLIQKTCRAHLLEEIQACRPEVLIPLGAEATKQVVGRAIKITKAHGIAETSDEHSGSVVLPFLNPGMVMMYPQHGPSFAADCATLRRLIDHDYDQAEASASLFGEYAIVDDLEFLIEQNPEIVFFDTENTSLEYFLDGPDNVREYDPTIHDKTFRPPAAILTMQFCIKPGEAYMLVWDHPERPIPMRRKAKLKEQIIRLLCRKGVLVVGQNLKYDNNYLFHQIGIRFKIGGDTLMIGALLDENMISKGQDALVKRYVHEMAGYADEFNATTDKSRMWEVPLSKLISYGCGDVDSGLRLFRVLYDELIQDKKLYEHYRRVSLPGLNTFAAVEYLGIRIDDRALDDFQEVMEATVAEQYATLIAQVPKSIKRLHIDKGLKFSRADFTLDILFRHKDGFKLKPKVFTKTTAKLTPDKRIPSTSSKDHLPYFYDDCPFTMGLSQYVKDERLLGTSVKGFRNKYIHDGLVRPIYSLWTTVTGRSSCVKDDTPIVTLRGIVRAADVVVGDYVWTHRNRWRVVSELFRKTPSRMYSLRLSNGEILTVTEEHKLLLTSGEWSKVGALLELGEDNALTVQGTLKGPRTNSQGCEHLPNPVTYNTGGSGYARRESSDGADNDRAVSSSRGIQSIKEYSISQEQTGGEESTVRARMGIRLRGWSRVPDEASGREEVLCTSDSVCGVSGDSCVTATGGSSSSPYRREPEEQSYREPSHSYAGRTPEDTRTIRDFGGGFAIEEVICAGVHRVYDFQVEEDHSYLACGVFNHNSENPNGQNFPKRGNNAKAYRRIFVPPPGYYVLEADLSQAELRISGDMAGDRTMLEIYRNKGDIHTATALIVMQITMEEFRQLPKKEQKDARSKAKAVNFGFIYGMGWRKFIGYAKTQYGVEFTEEEAQRIRTQFFDKYHALPDWHESMRQFAKRHKMVRSYSGRIRHLPMIDSDDEMVQAEAGRQAINCLSDDTEILTIDGWRTVDEVGNDTPVYSVNPATGTLEVDSISAVHTGFVNGRMLRLQGGAIDAISTPNHRWLVDQKGQGRNRGKVLTSFKTSEKLSKHGDHKIWLVGESLRVTETTWTDDEVLLMGWVLTDGHYRKGDTSGDGRVGVTQSKIQNIMEIDRLFNRLGRHYSTERSTGQYVWEITCPAGYRIRDMMPDKTLTGEVLASMSSRQHKILFQAMLRGDGCWDAEAQRYRKFCAGSKTRADAFLMLCTMIGQPASAKYRDTSQYRPKKYASMGNIPKTEGHWLVELKQRNRAQPQYGYTWINWTGRVWCPTTRNQTWVAKRNGKVFITGNSPVQGFGSDLGIMSIGRLHEEVDPAYLAPIAFVHDAIYCYVPKKYLEWGAKTLKWYMESNDIEEWFGVKMKAPIVADVSFGLNFGDTYEMGGLNLDDDFDFATLWENPEEPELDIPKQYYPPNDGLRKTSPYTQAPA